ncbi:TNT domain-containing protein [Amycolatopsis minnesotensis]|uniref:TNT domain-containing protein n=1 Tax=Amycolatopsis minnesotensis TaxID=337894 RepID=A0ABN2Q9L7_9PSEU
MAQPTTQLNATEQDTLVKQIGLALLRAAPRDWRRVTAQYRAVGRYHELTGEVATGDGQTHEWVATHDIATLFGKLRAGMYRDGRGTWFNARYQLDHPSSYNLEYDREEPEWDLAPPPQAYADELRMFPRSEENVPEWLLRRMSGLAPEQPGPHFRIARIFDGQGAGGRPVINRPELEVDEQDRVLDYLDHAPVVVSERGYDVDLLAASPAPAVPVAFHTDGVWIWPAAVNFYLQEYGVAPEPDLVQHIRSTGFALSEVGEQTVQAAAAHLNRGTPPQRPPGPPAPAQAAPPPAQAAPVQAAAVSVPVESRQPERASYAAEPSYEDSLGEPDFEEPSHGAPQHTGSAEYAEPFYTDTPSPGYQEDESEPARYASEETTYAPPVTAYAENHSDGQGGLDTRETHEPYAEEPEEKTAERPGGYVDEHEAYDDHYDEAPVYGGRNGDHPDRQPQSFDDDGGPPTMFAPPVLDDGPEAEPAEDPDEPPLLTHPSSAQPTPLSQQAPHDEGPATQLVSPVPPAMPAPVAAEAAPSAPAPTRREPPQTAPRSDEPPLNQLRTKLVQLGVPEDGYRIGGPADAGWGVEEIDEGWRVSRFDGGRPTSPAVFGDAEDAAAFMLGKLLLDPDGTARASRPEQRQPAKGQPQPPKEELPPQRPVMATLSPEIATGVAPPARRQEPPPEARQPAVPPPPPQRPVPDNGRTQIAEAVPMADASPRGAAPNRAEEAPGGATALSATPPQPPARRDRPRREETRTAERSNGGQPWPIGPMAGEPPLTLFRGKELRELPAGSELDRFGNPNGNLTYVAGTPFEERSLVPEWVNRPYHVYRVQRPLEALTGVAIPWFNQPGGGSAYLLPASVEELLADGDLIELDPGEPPID